MNIHDATSVTHADVIKSGIRAGYLRRYSTYTEFGYYPEYVEAGGRAIATTLPTNLDPIRTISGALPSFFSGLLPEGRRLIALQKAIKTSADDELSMLLGIGNDLIGDVQVVPVGQTPAPALSALMVDSWASTNFSDALQNSLGKDIDKVGLPGIQDKVSAQMISLPLRTKNSHYILKISPPNFPFLVENEAFFLKAAALSGLPTVESELVHDSQGRPGLAVHRFDRVFDAERNVNSLAVEDACQVLGRYPADKYTLTSENVVAGLTQITRSKPLAAHILYSQFIFAYLTGNGDAHAKNFSIVERRPSEWSISPAYDIPTSWPYGDYTMALSICGKTHNDITRKTLLEFAEQCGLRAPIAATTITNLLDRVDLWIHDLDQLPFTQKHIHKLRKTILYRRDQLK